MYEYPHRRYNPLTREWVLVSPHRARRPWQGHVEKTPSAEIPEYDPSCLLCPGNERANGDRNPVFPSTFIFDNDFAALLSPSNISRDSSQPFTLPGTDSLCVARPETGICRVVCFSPKHNLAFPQLTFEEAEAVIQTWSQETADLQESPDIAYVQVFENKGAIMGCSNPHPHSQIWAQSQLPNEIEKEYSSQSEYYRTNSRLLLLDYLAEERERGERIITANAEFTALVPFWAIWPFEILIISHHVIPNLPAMTSGQQRALTDILQRVTCRYDNLFEIPFPYSMGFHQAPNDGGQHPEWILHAHFYPPLLRSASVRKFMVGYEMLAMPQRDITPEDAASQLRELSEIHFTKR
jgi:UDPglucose--hexose-1-phosphate uridylyltransferase